MDLFVTPKRVSAKFVSYGESHNGWSSDTRLHPTIGGQRHMNVTSPMSTVRRAIQQRRIAYCTGPSS